MARSARTTRILRPTPTPACFTRALARRPSSATCGHLMMENRNGLIVDARLTEANGTAERTTALDMIEDNAKPGSTVGADKNYDTADFVAGCRERGCTPHVSQNHTNRRSAIDARTTRYPGYRISTIKRKRIEEPFGWIKTVGGLDPASWQRPSRVVLRAHRRSLQSRSYSEDAGSNGVSLSGASNMSENCAYSALYHPSIGSSSPAHQENRPSRPIFQQPASLEQRCRPAQSRAVTG